MKSTISGRRYKRTSIVAGQIGNKLIAPMVYDNTMHSAFFESWFEQCLLPSLKTKSIIIIINNTSFYRMTVLQELTGKFGHTVLPLSPSSPELNHIEKTWGNIKQYLRKVLPNFNSFGDALLSYSGFN